jgi:hypothetical protein
MEVFTQSLTALMNGDIVTRYNNSLEQIFNTDEYERNIHQDPRKSDESKGRGDNQGDTSSAPSL